MKKIYIILLLFFMFLPRTVYGEEKVEITITNQYTVFGGTINSEGIYEDVPHYLEEVTKIEVTPGEEVDLSDYVKEEVFFKGDKYILVDTNLKLKDNKFIANENTSLLVTYFIVEPIYNITVNIVDNNEVVENYVKTSRGSTYLLGEVEYDLEESIYLLRDTYQSDEKIFYEIQGDPMKGNLDGDKYINIIFNYSETEEGSKEKPEEKPIDVTPTLPGKEDLNILPFALPVVLLSSVVVVYFLNKRRK